MLKRQRPPSPPPTFFDTPISPPLKRCRPLQSTPSSDNKLHSFLPPRPSTENPTPEPEQQGGSGGDYQTSNNLLYEVHALHHHRLLFASPSPITPANPCGLPVYTNTYPLSRPVAESSTAAQNSDKGSQNWLPGQDNDHTSHPATSDPPDDSQLVAERYSETNRLLGSLVLSRRRDVSKSESR